MAYDIKIVYPENAVNGKTYKSVAAVVRDLKAGDDVSIEFRTPDPKMPILIGYKQIEIDKDGYTICKHFSHEY